jgi:hypothetical protein
MSQNYLAKIIRPMENNSPFLVEFVVLTIEQTIGLQASLLVVYIILCETGVWLAYLATCV